MFIKNSLTFKTMIVSFWSTDNNVENTNYKNKISFNFLNMQVFN